MIGQKVLSIIMIPLSILNDNKIEFIVNPYTRFKEKKGEQSTMFIKASSENCIEFKSFKNLI